MPLVAVLVPRRVAASPPESDAPLLLCALAPPHAVPLPFCPLSLPRYLPLSALFLRHTLTLLLAPHVVVPLGLTLLSHALVLGTRPSYALVDFQHERVDLFGVHIVRLLVGPAVSRPQDLPHEISNVELVLQDEMLAQRVPVPPQQDGAAQIHVPFSGSHPRLVVEAPPNIASLLAWLAGFHAVQNPIMGRNAHGNLPVGSPSPIDVQLHALVDHSDELSEGWLGGQERVLHRPRRAMRVGHKRLCGGGVTKTTTMEKDALASARGKKERRGDRRAALHCVGYFIFSQTAGTAPDHRPAAAQYAPALRGSEQQ